MAALQCQKQFGNHNEAKHKPGFLDLSEYLPTKYVDRAGAEREIYREHRKLYNMSEINSEFRYVQMCRLLKNYGVTFFHVKVSGHLIANYRDPRFGPRHYNNETTTCYVQLTIAIACSASLDLPSFLKTLLLGAYGLLIHNTYYTS